MAFRSRYAKADGRQLQVVVRRGGQELVRTGTLHVRTVASLRLRRDPTAAPAARAIFAGITGQ